MSANAIHAVVCGAGIAVIAVKWGENANSVIAVIRGAGVIVGALHQRVDAASVDTLVNGARIIVSAVEGGGDTASVHALVARAGVAVIANDGVVEALPSRLAEIFGADVAVIAFGNVRATSCTQIIGAGVSIGARNGNICGVAACREIARSVNMIIAYRDVAPGNVRSLEVTPCCEVAEIVVVI